VKGKPGFLPNSASWRGCLGGFRLRYLVKSADASTKALTAGQGRLCQSRLIEVLGGLVHRDMTTHHGLTSNSFKGECSTQGPDAFAHSR
jgi:hypothetical protein